MAQMRAVLVKNGAGGVENLYIGETPKPTLSPGQVLVKVSSYIATTGSHICLKLFRLIH